MAQFSYHCTALEGSNKAGTLKPDGDGYYEVVLGALNYFNTRGEFYALEPAKHLFGSSGILMRKVKSGNLKGEEGHPRFQPGMTKADFLYRLMDTYEPNVCMHIAEVGLDDKRVKDKNGESIVAIMGRVKGSGPHGEAFDRSMTNAKENMCFSLRAVTDDFKDKAGTVIRVIKEIYTWDRVNEGGIRPANKYNSPALEDLMSMDFDMGHLKMTRNLALSMSGGLESDTIQAINQTMTSLGWTGDTVTTTASGIILPPSMRW